jgi:hypothetical protein
MTWILVLFLAGGSGCDADTLMKFTPKDGEVQKRERLPGKREVFKVREVLESHSRPCLKTETADACKQRVLTAAKKRLPGQDVQVELTGKPDGVRAVIRVDGKRQEGRYASYEHVAEHMKKLQSQGKQVVLELAEIRLDPKTRKAEVTVSGDREVVHQTPPGVRLIWKPADRDLSLALKSLHDQLAARGFVSTRFEPQADKTVIVEFTCP